ncbi:hypothetical protein HETIRDRAFT_433609 [Heterobasidion irregulare TC 32-1]|uniref:Uncharacterized protein n=1 Tax=Heterobasidion irregulare (strain TC 32-1) TaxID=747525 RepID=W4KAB4_HETIT|nr:uncharacterized protein HETIRDRAFT_433609 [Heterobasidion irregulare TC 32-1]ETW82728.1 hypothetical protein HETIRDRAFT_433609 [Heterobasidion irregulare TC 32-1]
MQPKSTHPRSGANSTSQINASLPVTTEQNRRCAHSASSAESCRTASISDLEVKGGHEKGSADVDARDERAQMGDRSREAVKPCPANDHEGCHPSSPSALTHGIARVAPQS